MSFKEIYQIEFIFFIGIKLFILRGKHGSQKRYLRAKNVKFFAGIFNNSIFHLGYNFSLCLNFLTDERDIFNRYVYSHIENFLNYNRLEDFWCHFVLLRTTPIMGHICLFVGISTWWPISRLFGLKSLWLSRILRKHLQVV